MENIEYFLQQQQKQLELEQARLTIANDGGNKPDVETATRSHGDDPFKLYDEIMASRPQQDSDHEISSPELIKSRPPTAGGSMNPIKNSNDMDQWVTDAFYSYFPSLNKVEVEKRSKSRAQLRQEYNEYLKRKPHLDNHLKPTVDVKKVGRRNIVANEETVSPPIHIQQQSASENSGRKFETDETIALRENSPRYKHLKDLQHTDLTKILNSDAVAQRNKRAIEDENRKKMDYQRDLVKQIEDKRLEIERLKKKEKYEEDLLTKRLEDQLKTLELEEELEKEKKFTEKTRLANEQNHILRMHILSKLDNDHKIYNPYEVRETQSENGKDKFIEQRDNNLGNVSRSSEDNKIYKYFCNSARNEKLVLPEIVNHHHYNNKNQHNKYCKTCQSVLPIEWAHFYGDKLDMCPKCVKVCPFCNHHRHEMPSLKNTASDNNHLRHVNKNLQHKIHRESEQVRIQEPETEEDNRDIEADDDDDDDFTVDLNPIYTQSRNHKPFSMNLEKDSIFNPSNRIPESKVSVNIKNGEVFVDNVIEKPLKFNNNMEKLKEKTDEKLGKYFRNYDDIRKRRSSNGANSKMPKITNSFQVLEDTPIHKINSNTRNDDIRVLTKLGAIRKQLQLEQLEMDYQRK